MNNCSLAAEYYCNYFHNLGLISFNINKANTIQYENGSYYLNYKIKNQLLTKCK